jgi:hypothetical protein
VEHAGSSLRGHNPFVLFSDAIAPEKIKMDFFVMFSTAFLEGFRPVGGDAGQSGRPFPIKS